MNSNPTTPTGWTRIFVNGGLAWRRGDVMVRKRGRHWHLWDLRGGAWEARDEPHRVWMDAVRAADGGGEE